jgi:hypothetical protein
MRQIPFLCLGLAVSVSSSVPVMADVPAPTEPFAQKLGSLQNAMRSGEVTIAPFTRVAGNNCDIWFCQYFSQFSQQFSQFSNIPFCGYGGRC